LSAITNQEPQSQTDTVAAKQTINPDSLPQQATQTTINTRLANEKAVITEWSNQATADINLPNQARWFGALPNQATNRSQTSGGEQQQIAPATDSRLSAYIEDASHFGSLKDIGLAGAAYRSWPPAGEIQESGDKTLGSPPRLSAVPRVGEGTISRAFGSAGQSSATGSTSVPRPPGQFPFSSAGEEGQSALSTQDMTLLQASASAQQPPPSQVPRQHAQQSHHHGHQHQDLTQRHNLPRIVGLSSTLCLLDVPDLKKDKTGKLAMTVDRVSCRDTF